MKIPPAILAQHLAVLGKTGSGKTSTAKLAIEQVVADGSRVCILDPIKSDWWGLTSSADGRKAGLAFHIMGGPHGHVPLHAKAGKAIAEIVASGKLPLSIVDMADFGPKDHAAFFIDFAEALFRNMQGVLYLVVEEAHIFAPKEQAGFGGESMSTHWLNKIATGARSKGIRLIVCTQRTQALHNAVLGSCDTIIAHRLTLPADQKPVLEWLKGNIGAEQAKEVGQTLSSLKTGEAWLCSGEAKLFERRQFPRISTYDNSATPTGDTTHNVRTAPIDAAKLSALIGAAVEEAKANDPKELRRRIAELEKQLSKSAKPVQTVDQGAMDRAVAGAVAARDREWQAAIKERETIIGSLTGRMAKIEQLAHVNGDAKPKTEVAQFAVPAKESRPLAAKMPQNKPVSGGTFSAPAKQSRPSVDSGTLPKGEAATLQALIQYPDGLRREQLTVLTGYKRSSRDAYIQRLREKGFADQSGDRVMATDDGLAVMPDAAPLPTGDELQAFWLARLPAGEKAILEVLIEQHPNTLRRDELDELTGYKRSSRDAYLQRLAAKELIVEPSRGEVRATDQLF